MRGIHMAWLALPIALSATAAAAATRDFPVGPFERVELAGPFDVAVHAGRGGTARATGSADAISRVTFTMRGTTLVVSARPERFGGGLSWNRAEKLLVSLTTPTLSGVALSGAGDLAVDRARAPQFDVALSGAGDIRIGAVEAGLVRIAHSGAGDVTVAGRAQRVQARLSGKGDIDAEALSAADVQVELRGMGDADLAASRFAQVKLSGLGDVTIHGTARCAIEKRGLGDVTCGR